MAQLTNNEHNTENNNSQQLSGDLGNSKTVNPPEKPEESWEDYKARVWAKCHQSLPLSAESDDLPFPPTDLLLDWLVDLTEHLPAGEVLVPLLSKGLWSLQSLTAIAKSLHNITESLNAQPDYTGQLQELIELWKETNRHLGNIAKHMEEPPYPTYEGSHPHEPPPSNQGDKHVNF